MENLRIIEPIQIQAKRSVYLAETSTMRVIVKDNADTMRFQHELDVYKRLMSVESPVNRSYFPRLLDVDGGDKD